MGYIKFAMPVRWSDSKGNPQKSKIRMLETDMGGVEEYDTNLIMHALSAKYGKVQTHKTGFIYEFPICFDL